MIRKFIFIKELFENYLPWIFTRRLIFLHSVIECILFFIVFKASRIFIGNHMAFFAFALYFIILSYIFGRYNYKQERYIKLKDAILKPVSIFTFYLVSIFFFQRFLDSDFLIFKSLVIFISYFSLCILIQFLFTLNVTKSYIGKNKWIFVGDLGNYINFINFSKLGRVKSNVIFYRDLELIGNLSFSSIEGIIIEEQKLSFEDEFFNIKKIQENNIPIYDVFKWCEIYLQRFPDEILINDETKINNFLKPKYSFQQRLKIISEFLLSFFLLLLTSPLILIFGFFIWLNDKGPILYSQIRVGKNEKCFRIWKLRSMKVNAEKDGIKWSQRSDERVTFVGNLIRKTRIDELPQLFSVITGDMSLIGPRPERPEIDELLKKKINNYELRYAVKPGISGWAQVNYPYGASIQDSKNKLSFDLYYVKNISFLLDFLIFFKTIKTVFNLESSTPIK